MNPEVARSATWGSIMRTLIYRGNSMDSIQDNAISKIADIFPSANLIDSREED